MSAEHRLAATPENESDPEAFVASFWAGVAISDKDGTTRLAKHKNDIRLEHPLGQLEKFRADSWVPGSELRERRWMAVALAVKAITTYCGGPVDAKTLKQRSQLVEDGGEMLLKLSKIIRDLDDNRIHDKDLAGIMAGHPLANDAQHAISTIKVWLEINRPSTQDVPRRDTTSKGTKAGPVEKYMAVQISGELHDRLGDYCTAAVAAVISATTGKNISARQVYDWVSR